MGLRMHVYCDRCGLTHYREPADQMAEALTARQEAAREGWTHNPERRAVDLCGLCSTAPIPAPRGSRCHDDDGTPVPVNRG